ncbi:Gfo/Idh/MocA family protein [Bacillus sinesaloumensis]|uniref:Gfo/Idh/MocA family protein n=1 Tax=Litchfieldia sinesaloumensis TaxID=1926280 RepID=UPI0009884947|nr:Gfo/Idh/MocA family oxidoreductase [Bacillus sinesaloumensis]
MTRKIRFGIIGCGVISPLHAEAIKACPNTELVAVSDLSLETARKFANAFNISTYVSDYKDLLAMKEIDVVSICTPSGTHGQIAIDAALAKKSILCEKPLEIKADRMTQMIQICREQGVKLGCVYQRRATGVVKRVKEAISNGEIGKLILCDAYLKYYRDQAYYDSAGWRGTWEMDGGGALMNQGVHGIDLFVWLTGGVSKVFARAAALTRNIEVEDTAVSVVECKNGAFGVIEGTTSVFPERSTRIELYGEKGTIIFDDSGIQEWVTKDKGDITKEIEIELKNIEGVRSIGHYHFIDDMAKAIIEDREPMVTGEEARKAVDLILSIYESSKQQKEVYL